MSEVLILNIDKNVTFKSSIIIIASSDKNKINLFVSGSSHITKNTTKK